MTAALSTFLVGLVLEQWAARVVASAMAVVFIVYAFFWGGLILFSQRQHPQAWRAAAPTSKTPEWSEHTGH